MNITARFAGAAGDAKRKVFAIVPISSGQLQTAHACGGKNPFTALENDQQILQLNTPEGTLIFSLLSSLPR